MKGSVNGGRSLPAVLVAALALFAAAAICAGEAPAGGSDRAVEAGSHQAPDFGLERVHRTTDAAERSAKQAGASSEHGVRPMADAVQRGIDRTGKAVARATEKKPSVIRQHHSMLAPPP